MDYKTVYEIAADPVSGFWQLAVHRGDFWVGLCIAVPVLFMLFRSPSVKIVDERNIEAARRTVSKLRTEKGLYQHLGTSLIVILLFVVMPLFRFGVAYFENRSLACAYKDGQCPPIEGRIPNFVYGYPYKGTSNVRFSIDGREVGISYNAPGVTPEVCKALKNGALVRIWAKPFSGHKVLNFPLISWPVDDSVAIARLDVAEEAPAKVHK